MYSRFPTRPRKVTGKRPLAADASVPDLQSQFEALLSAVWAAEENWRFDDRLDLAVKQRRA